jgi:drug/metabolite transporter (DMT)-like permease
MSNGYEYLILWAFFSSLQPIAFKYLSGNYDGINNLFMNQICIICFSTLFLLYKISKNKSYLNNKPFPSNVSNPLHLTESFEENCKNKRVILYSIACVVCYMSLNYCFTLLPISLSVPIACLTVFAALISDYFINKTPITKSDMVASIIVTVGVILVSYSSSSSDMEYSYDKILAIIVLFLATMLSGCLSTLTKSLASLLPLGEAYFLQNYTGWIVAVIVWFIYICTGKEKNNYPNSFEILVALCWFFFIEGGIINICKFLSFEYFSSFLFSLFGNIRLFFSLLFGYYLFNEEITYLKVGGAFLIFLGCILIALKK